MNMRGHEFRRGVLPSQGGQFVEIVVVDGVENTAQLRAREADVDQEIGGIEPFGEELGFHRESRAVQALRRAEFLAAETVRDHDVVADRQAVHVWLP